jgi:hypothetical protein
MSARRAAIAAWLVFAAVVWNVAFDRQVSIAAVRFANASAERYQSGAALVSIDSGFRPLVREAAADATIWSGAVALLGLGLIRLAARRTPTPRVAGSSRMQAADE